MKESPKEKSVLINFSPGEISRSGFLGHDERHIHDIVKDDQKRLSASGLSSQDISKRLQVFIDTAKAGLEGPVNYEHYVVQLQWVRGRVPCPFGEPGLHPKISVRVKNTKNNQTLHYTQLSVHLIQDHGFYGGRGSKFRIEPDFIVHHFLD